MNELNIELKKLHHSKKVIEQNFPEGNFQDALDDLKALKEKYNIRPCVLKEMVNLYLTEDELLHTLKKD